MPLDYESLVGHLYVVGGRSISTMPPGTLVEVAPTKAARGRETDTFFTLVMPSGDTTAPAVFYEEMAALSAERYFSSSGSVTAGLRSVFNSLNENLVQHNTTDSRRYEASILCAVLRGEELFLGKVGAGIALLCRDGQPIPFPAEFTNDDALYGPPLGVQPVPDMKLARYTVETGTRLILSDPNLADLDMGRLQEALSARDLASALVTLRDQIANQASLLVAEFVPPEVPAGVPVREGESTAELSKSRATGDSPRAAAEGADRTRRPRTPSPVGIAARAALSKGALGGAALARGAGRAFDILMPLPKEGKRSRWATPAVAGAAILIPVVVVLLVIILWVSGTDESEFDRCVNEATTAGSLARGIASSDVAGTIAAWNAVITVVERCNDIRAGDTALAALADDGRQIIDRLLQVARRATTPINSFPNAGLTRLVLQGEDLYALDDRNDLVYRIKLTTNGREMIPGSQQAIPSMRRNAAVAEFTVGDILDITWATDGSGLSQPNVLLALDNRGVLIECPPRFLESISCAAQRLLGTETWAAPKAITMWQSRLYILDPGANQIWRYEPVGGAYAASPTEYFVGEGRPDIRSAVDFGIDSGGQVYVLLGGGAILKFNSGERLPFGFASFPEGQEITGANAMFLNTNPIAQGLLIVHQAQRTVYETTLAGTFIAAYRAQDENLFTSLSDVVVDTNQRMIYTSSGNAIFGFQRAQ